MAASRLRLGLSVLALCFCAIPLTAQEAETDEAEYRSSIELFVGGVTETEESTRECLAIVVERKLRSDDVLHTLAELFAEHGAPEHLRSDNGPEFTAKVVRTWLKRVGVRTLFIEPGSPWENGYNESFNGKLKDELMNREIFYSLKEAQVLVEQWRREYNTIRPHSALGYRPPAPQAVRPAGSWLRRPVLQGPRLAAGLT